MTDVPMTRRISLQETYKNVIRDLMTADKSVRRGKQMGNILLRIYYKVRLKCYEKQKKADKRSVDRAVWFRQLYEIISFDRFASLSRIGKREMANDASSPKSR